jgi:hypothetical protein
MPQAITLRPFGAFNEIFKQSLRIASLIQASFILEAYDEAASGDKTPQAPGSDSFKSDWSFDSVPV